MSEKTKKRNFRRRRQSSDDDEDSDNEDVVSTVVEDTKILQQMRKKPHGVNLESLARGAALHAKESKGKKDPFKMATGGYVDMKALKRGISEDLDADDDLDIGTSFAAETNRRDEDADMVKYVEEELARRKGVVAEEKEAGKETTSRQLNAEDALYQLPDHLKDPSNIKRTNEDMLSSQMLSGIPEVDLGIEAKIRNIEATEEAKAAIIRQKKEKKNAGDIFVPTNMAVNFVQHNRFKLDHDHGPNNKRPAPAPKPEPLRVGDADRPRTEKHAASKTSSAREKATDDFHYEKFRKQMRRY